MSDYYKKFSILIFLIIGGLFFVNAQEKDTDDFGSYNSQRFNIPAPLQTILNALPAIPIAGNDLKFIFDSDKWTATVNGENFSAGTIELEDTENGAILTLKQTHIWPGAVGRTAGRIANIIPGGSAVSGALDTAGRITGAAGAIEASGPAIILEYKAGPPASLSFLRSAASEADPSDKQIPDNHPLTAENRFDLDGFNVFAVSFYGLLRDSSGLGGGVTFTVFEQYKPNAFFNLSYFISGSCSFAPNVNASPNYILINISTGVLFKHRFPGNRFLWNLGASLELMSVIRLSGHYRITYYDYDYDIRTGEADYRSDSDAFLVGMGIQTGFSFRFNPYTSFDLNGFVKLPFGTVEMIFDDGKYLISGPESISFWPFTGGIQLGFTLWFPYRSRR